MDNSVNNELDTLHLVDIDFMNITHLEEIGLAKKTGQLVKHFQQNKTYSESEIDEITLALHTWLEYTQNHFHQEREMMEKTSFPAILQHEEAHTNALARMHTVMNIWKERQDIQHLHSYIFDVWPTWFSEHVNSLDIMTAKHANKSGFNEEL